MRGAPTHTRRGGLAIEHVASFPAALAERAVAAPPARVLKEGRRGRIYVAELEGRAVCVKELYRQGFWRRLLAPFRPSGNRVAWEAAHLLRRAAFPTPEPFALVEERGGRSWYLCALIEDATRLDDYYQSIPGRFSLRRCYVFARRLGELLRSLHMLEIFHRDLAPQNLLVRERGDDWELFLVDLESVRLGRPLTRERRLRNLLQLSSLYPDPFSDRLRQRVLKSYAGARGPYYNAALIEVLAERVKEERAYCRRWYIKDYGHDPMAESAPVA